MAVRAPVKSQITSLAVETFRGLMDITNNFLFDARRLHFEAILTACGGTAAALNYVYNVSNGT